MWLIGTYRVQLVCNNKCNTKCNRTKHRVCVEEMERTRARNLMRIENALSSNSIPFFLWCDSFVKCIYTKSTPQASSTSLMSTQQCPYHVIDARYVVMLALSLFLSLSVANGSPCAICLMLCCGALLLPLLYRAQMHFNQIQIKT